MELAQLIRTASASKPSAADTRDILFASSEVAPFSKTGGLADVAASLPKALTGLGHRVSIITPLYSHLDPDELHLSRRIKPLSVPRLGKYRNKVEATVWEGRTEGGVRIFFVEQDDFFGQEGNLYGYEDNDYEDNPARFSFFSRAIIEFALQFSVPVDVIHCNDWHTALAPIYRDHYYSEELADVGVVLTIHNLAFQGSFDAEALSQTGLPKKFYKAGELRQDDGINFLQGGIVHADQVTTVSPTYAEEIQSAEGGFGLEEILSGNADKLSGVLNGADYTVWSPDIDHYIEVQYDLERLNGKRRNKAELQHRFELPIRPTLPMLAFVGRLTEQKGLDLLVPAVEKLVDSFEDDRDGFQMLFLGEGHNSYADKVKALAEKFPKRIAAHIGYSEELAHKIQAGADLLVIPSRYEPCGLTQLYAMKYGTLPIVHATGGLADTVVDPKGDEEELSTGFIFEDYDEDALSETITRATKRYRNYRKWRPLVENAMKQDFSWGSSARQYIDIYNNALNRGQE
ncbi:glycogen synthase GlgA [Persicimonas caeni]|uniref:Glycogen synthase n=1 Tax=Persicimonas caeni TaxID=2292766 RepID=A0A4Y6PND3_PERCE|nr:glycogen synthase GlgA [Persicimonas caeni]QDG49729.1 glycogen synthase GlgA [Persicimonas caeni]QED30950.1 glycogen synthase GlgA [Persicimonas caeni]